MELPGSIPSSLCTSGMVLHLSLSLSLLFCKLGIFVCLRGLWKRSQEVMYVAC